MRWWVSGLIHDRTRRIGRSSRWTCGRAGFRLTERAKTTAAWWWRRYMPATKTYTGAGDPPAYFTVTGGH
jgi:hypothetical protein